MSKCSKKCNEIEAKIHSISGLEKYVTKVVDSISKYADEDELNGTCFKKYIKENK